MKIAKKIFKILFIGIIVLLNVLVWGRIFVSCDAPLTKKIMLDEQTLTQFKNDPTSLTVLEYPASITSDSPMQMDLGDVDLGKVQLRYVTHIVETDDLQFTIKYHIEYFKDRSPLKFVLRCVSGDQERTFEDLYTMSQDRFIFRYVRFSCQNIGFGEDDTVLLDVYTSDGRLFTTFTLVSPELNGMVQRPASLKTIAKD